MPEFIRELPATGHRINVHSFKLVTLPKYAKATGEGIRLRFAVSWWLEMAGGRVLGWELKGFLARLDKYGNVIFTPPQNRSGFKFYNVMWMTPDFYRAVLECVAACPLVGKLVPDGAEGSASRAHMDAKIQQAYDKGLEAGAIGVAVEDSVEATEI